MGSVITLLLIVAFRLVVVEEDLPIGDEAQALVAAGRARINPPENMTLSDLSARKQERFARSSIAQAKSVSKSRVVLNMW